MHRLSTATALWVLGFTAFWVLLTAIGVVAFAPIYANVCADCGTPLPGQTFGPGSWVIYWPETLKVAAGLATVVTLVGTGVVALVRRTRRSSGQ